MNKAQNKGEVPPGELKSAKLIKLIEMKEKSNVATPLGNEKAIATPTLIQVKDQMKVKEKTKEIKEENYLPFSLHYDLFVPPSHYIIKRETQMIFQLIEKDVIELEKNLKSEFIGIFNKFYHFILLKR